jgi:hypothetical protein
VFPKFIMALVVIGFSAVVHRRRRRVLPFAGVLLLVSIFFSRVYWRTGAFTLRFESLACLFLGLTFAYDLWKGRIKPALDVKIGLVLAMFPVMVIPSAVVSPSPLTSLKKTLIYVPYLLAFAALAHYLRRKDALPAAWDVFLWAGTFSLGLSVAGLVLFLSGVDLGMIRMALGTLWLRGTFVVPNILGSTAVLVLVAGFVRLVSTRQEARPGIRASAPLLILASAGVLTSMTRSAWLCAAAGTAVVGLYGLIRRNWTRTLAGLTCIGLALFATYEATSRIPVRLGSLPAGRSLGEFGEPGLDSIWGQRYTADRFNYFTKSGPGLVTTQTQRTTGYLLPSPAPRPKAPADLSLVHRRQTALSALSDWRSSPIIGRGTESLAIAESFTPTSYISSTWVSILHDWGLLGLGLHFAFLFLVAVGLVKAFRKPASPPGREIAFALILVLGLSTFMYQSATTIQLSIFWVLLALYSAAASGSLAGDETTVSTLRSRPTRRREEDRPSRSDPSCARLSF